MMLSIKTQEPNCCNAECCVHLIIILNSKMLSVGMLNVIMLSVVILKDIMLSVIILNVIMPNANVTNIIMLSVIKLSFECCYAEF